MAAATAHVLDAGRAKGTIQALDTKVSSRRLSKFWEVLSKDGSGFAPQFIANLTRTTPSSLEDKQASNILKSLHATYWKETGETIPLTSEKTADEAKKSINKSPGVL